MRIFFVAWYTWDIWSVLTKRLRELWYVVVWISGRIDIQHRCWIIEKVVEKYKNKNLTPVLINCIWCWVYWKFLQLTEDDFKQSFECNFLVPIKIIQIFAKAVLKVLPDRENKKYVININSQAALKPFWYGWAYNSMKSALAMALKVFEKEYRQYGFKIKQFYPTVIRTKMIQKMPYFPKEDKIVDLDKFVNEIVDEIMTVIDDKSN